MNTSVLTIAALKGGTAKSTTAGALAGAAGGRGSRVLVVDMDTQTSASLSLGVAGAPPEETAGALLQQGGAAQVHDVVRRNVVPGVDLVPGHGSELQAAASRLMTDPVDGSFVLRGLLDQVDDYDLVIVDTPSAPGPLVTNALVAATALLAPMTPSAHALKGALDAMRLSNSISKRQMNPDLRVLGAALMRVDGGGREVATREVIRQLDKVGAPVLNTWVRRDTMVERALLESKPVTVRYPSSRASVGYNRLLDEITPMLKAGRRHGGTDPDHIRTQAPGV